MFPDNVLLPLLGICLAISPCWMYVSISKESDLIYRSAISLKATITTMYPTNLIAGTNKISLDAGVLPSDELEEFTCSSGAGGNADGATLVLIEWGFHLPVWYINLYEHFVPKKKLYMKSSWILNSTGTGSEQRFVSCVCLPKAITAKKTKHVKKYEYGFPMYACNRMHYFHQ